ncbi:MAG: hypothetical protein R2797_10900 [Gelidibacter sp.]
MKSNQKTNVASKIKNLWKDPVMSKVISVGIIGLLSIIYNLIISLLNNVDFRIAFINFWNFKLKLWQVLVVVILLFLIKIFINKVSRQEYRQYIYDDDSLKLDINLFNKIRNELLPQDGTISFLRHHNFGASFIERTFDPLFNFAYESSKSDFEFLNPEIEKFKLELVDSIKKFNDLLTTNTFSNGPNSQSVPKEWIYEQTERHTKVVKELNDYADKICADYDNLIKLCRKILKN